jgi:hypothetical protein
VHLEHSEGREADARRHIDRALEILEGSAFRLSPNWWSADAFRTFVEFAEHPAVAELVAPPRVVIAQSDDHWAALRPPISVAVSAN